MKPEIYVERSGKRGSPIMFFIHPNPLDASVWIYQTAHFSTWFRCIAIDLPGYSRSAPLRSDTSLEEIAAWCWSIIDAERSETADDDAQIVLVGCSIGSYVAQYMYRQRPSSVSGVVLSGAGWRAKKDFVRKRIDAFTREGIGYRNDYAKKSFSSRFASSELGQWFVDSICERDATSDAGSIIRLFRALGEPDPDDLQSGLLAPVLILSGSEDNTHAAAFDLEARLPDARLVTLEGAGHACQAEQPSNFNGEMLTFLTDIGALPRRE